MGWAAIPDRPAARRATGLTDRVTYGLILVYLVLEYARPPDPMKLPMLISTWLFVSWLVQRKRWNVQVYGFLALLGAAAVNVPLAVNNYSAYMGLRTLSIELLCVSVPVMHFVASMGRVHGFVRVLVVVSLYVALYALTHGGVGPGGHVGDENDVALALAMVLPFAYAAMLGARSLTGRLACGGACVTMVAGVVATLSRGGFIGLVTVMAYCLTGFTSRKWLILPLAGFVAIAAWVWVPPAYWGEMGTIAGDAVDEGQGTGALRREYWAIAWRMFASNPLVGVGLGNFTWNVPAYQSADQLARAGRSYAGNVAHSLYFTLLAELGLLGMGAFAAIVVGNLKDTAAVIKTGRPVRGGGRGETSRGGLSPTEEWQACLYARAIRGSMLGYLVSGLFLTVLDYPHFWLVTGLAGALRQAVGREAPDGEPGASWVVPAARETLGPHHGVTPGA